MIFFSLNGNVPLYNDIKKYGSKFTLSLIILEIMGLKSDSWKHHGISTFT